MKHIRKILALNEYDTAIGYMHDVYAPTLLLFITYFA